MGKENLRNILICLSLFVITLSTRLLVAPGNNSFTSYDSGNYCLASISYSIENDRPHLPGYFLYVQLVKNIYQITHNFYYSLLFLSILFSSISSVFVYLILKNYFKIIQSYLLTLIILFNPLVWFYGSSTEIYAFDLFFSSLVFYTGIQRNGIYFLPILIALGTGVRQTSGLLLLPLCFYFLYRSIKDKELEWNLFITSLVPCILAFLLWFIPMTNSVGGINNYIELSTHHNPIPRNLISGGISSLAKNLVGLASYGIFPAIPTLVSLLFYFINKFFGKAVSYKNTTDTKKPPLSLLNERTSGVKNKSFKRNSLIRIGFWLIPPILFFMFIYYAKGYILLVFPVIIIIPSFFILKNLIGNKMLFFILVLQVAVFLFFPCYYPHYEDNSNYKNRALSKIDLTIDRFFSYYSMSYSHLKDLEMYYKEIDSLLTKSRINSEIDIFIDPTIIPNQRVLQVIYPSRAFLRYDHTDYDRYWIYKGIDNVKLSDLETGIRYSAIISSNMFFKKYLINYTNESLSTNHFTLFIPMQEKIGIIKDVYNNYFQKIGY